MPKQSQGTTANWNGTVFREVVSVSVDGSQSNSVEILPRNSLRVVRHSPTDVDYGTITMVARNTTGMQMSNVGTTANLEISGPDAYWQFDKAMYERLNWQAATGELQTYSVTFKVWKES
jgi:hypothetical protein